MRCKYSFLKVGTWNIEGAYAKINNFYVNKLRDPEFIQNAQNHDILCVQETHCGPHDNPGQHLTKFTSTPHCRKKSANNRFFGGMLLFIRKSIRKGVKVTYTEDPDILGITLKKDFFNMPEDVLIWFVYASPVNSPYYHAKNRENTVFKLEQKLALGTAGQQLIMGDLNGRTGEVEDFIREDNDHHSPAQEASTYIPDVPIPRKKQ